MKAPFYWIFAKALAGTTPTTAPWLWITEGNSAIIDAFN